MNWGIYIDRALSLCSTNEKEQFILTKQLLLVALGFLSLFCGAVGIIIPILPTTPFVLLAAILFSASNPKLAKRLEQNRIFGPYISHYKNKTGVPLSAKKKALTWLWVSLSLSALAIRELKSILILMAVGIGVSAHILTLKKTSSSVASGKSYQYPNTQDHQQ
ncbi:MAG: DUF454 domain-containing protein [Spirochaetia bacterium]|nr:DUF454 domain-containing protein [Spirochaetia bacterium]